MLYFLPNRFCLLADFRHYFLSVLVLPKSWRQLKCISGTRMFVHSAGLAVCTATSCGGISHGRRWRCWKESLRLSSGRIFFGILQSGHSACNTARRTPGDPDFCLFLAQGRKRWPQWSCQTNNSRSNPQSQAFLTSDILTKKISKHQIWKNEAGIVTRRAKPLFEMSSIQYRSTA